MRTVQSDSLRGARRRRRAAEPPPHGVQRLVRGPVEQKFGAARQKPGPEFPPLTPTPPVHTVQPRKLAPAPPVRSPEFLPRALARPVRRVEFPRLQAARGRHGDEGRRKAVVH